jgi:hypothetical protein
MLPAYALSRFKGISIDDTVKCKIFGKPKEHSIQTLLQAGILAYP